MALGRLRQPDLILYLNRPMSSLQKNIQKRGRRYEQNMDQAYLQKLSERYMYHLKNHWQRKLIHIEADEWDFLQDAESISRFASMHLEKYLY